MQTNYVNTVPEGPTPVYGAKQDDNGRVIRCDLFENGVAYDLTGAEPLTLRYKQPSGTFSAIAVTNTGDDYVDITIPSAMTNEPGFVYCKLRINSVGIKAFYLNVVKEV